MVFDSLDVEVWSLLTCAVVVEDSVYELSYGCIRNRDLLISLLLYGHGLSSGTCTRPSSEELVIVTPSVERNAIPALVIQDIEVSCFCNIHCHSTFCGNREENVLIYHVLLQAVEILYLDTTVIVVENKCQLHAGAVSTEIEILVSFTVNLLCSVRKFAWPSAASFFCTIAIHRCGIPA